MPANTTLGLLLEAKTTGQQDIDKLTDALNKFTGAAENSAKRTEDANKKASESTKQYAEIIKSALSEPFTTASQQAEKFALSLGKVGGITAGIIGGMVAIGAGAFELTKHYAEAAKATINFSERLGISIGQAQKLGAQAKLSGVDIGVLESSTRILATALEDSSGSGQKAYKALLQLGVASRTSSGDSRELGQVMIDVIEKLSKVEDVTKRTALASQILGRSSKEIQPLIEEYEKSKAVVEALGVGISENGTRKLAELHEEFTKTGIAFDVFKKKLAENITPIIIPVLLNFNNGGVAGVLRGLDALTPGGIISKRLGLGRGKGDDLPFTSHVPQVNLGGFNLQQGLADYQADLAAGAAAVPGYQQRFITNNPEFITSQLEENKKKAKELQNSLLDPKVVKSGKDQKDAELRALDLEIQKLEQRLKLIQNSKNAEEELLKIRESVGARTAQSDLLSKYLGINPDLIKSGAINPERDLTAGQKQFLQFAQPGVTGEQRDRAAAALQPQIEQEIVERFRKAIETAQKGVEEALKQSGQQSSGAFFSRFSAFSLPGGLPGLTFGSLGNPALGGRNLAGPLATATPLTPEELLARKTADVNADRARDERDLAERQPLLEQSVTTAAQTASQRSLAGVRIGGIFANPQDQIARIRATAAAQKASIADSYNFEKSLTAAKYDDQTTREIALNLLRLKNAQDLQEIEIQAAEKVAELYKQRIEENKQFAGNLFDAITGGTTRQFFSGILHNTGRTVFENVFSSILNGGKFQLPGQTDANGQPNILGKLLQGSAFGIDPTKNAEKLSVDINTLATNANTVALDTLIQLMGGTVPAGAVVSGAPSGTSTAPLNFGGFNIPGLTSNGGAFEQGIGQILTNALPGGSKSSSSILGSISSLSKLFGGRSGSSSVPFYGPTLSQLNGDFGSGEVPFEGNGTPGAGLGNGDFGGETGGASISSANSIAGPLFDPNASTSSQVTSAGLTAATVYAGTQAALHDFRQGGAYGTIGGIGAVAGTAAAVDPEPISKAVLTTVALVAQGVDAIIGDPRQNRQNLINKRLFNDQFAAPTPVNVTESTGGSYVANDRFGNLINTDLSPYPSVQEPYLDPSNKVNVPGRVLNPFGGGSGSVPTPAPSVVVQYSSHVSAIDGPSVQRVLDDHAAVLTDSLSKAVNRGHGEGLLNSLRQRFPS
jgi:hypothetical protein